MKKVKDEQLPEYENKLIRIRHRNNKNTEYVGLVTGRDYSSAMAKSPTSTAHPWVLRTQDGGDICFVPDDWHIEFVQDDAV